MKVLIAGATGFVGRHLARDLVRAGHQVVGCARRPASAARRFSELTWMGCDYRRDLAPASWHARLRGIDAVINAVGILRQRGSQGLAVLHTLAPRALFRACEEAGIEPVIQVSALGADHRAVSQYHRSKVAGDDALRETELGWAVLQPSLIYGQGSASTRLFRRLAGLPLIPLIADGEQLIQPIHVEDLCAIVRRLLEPDAPRRITVPLVGPEPVSMREYLQALRQGMGRGPGRFVHVPLPLVRAGAWLGDLGGVGPIGAETLEMLLRDNVADPAWTRALLGRDPRPVSRFLGPPARATLRWTT